MTPTRPHTGPRHMAEAELVNREDGVIRLSDLYDADKRTRDGAVRQVAYMVRIPHPLRNVQYADGIDPCTHAKKHDRFQPCPRSDRP